ncbi:lipopolysaccharide biosynthesis protein [Exiguobacterium oxidotolerans]|uniref:Polysaccharide biosynthesis protein n=1 Tax=Exiguobacterium oxidotolerans TaxID=223958 RepID=A0A653IIC9_9BACL|nr:hypothetical protein [Exiguobacterium oxidotolerans]VWX38380.1 conserved membrane hypothetical protein [Exiguobacterium oxidotolerans]
MTSFLNRHAVILIFPLLDVLLNVVNYAYHLLLARELSSVDYGLLNAYLALLGLLLIIGSALQWTVTRDLSQQLTNQYRQLRLRLLLYTGIILLILMYVLPFILPFTKINLLLLTLTILIHILLSFRRGVLQAEERFYALNFSYYVESVVKVAATWIFLSYTDVTLALLFILLGMTLAYFSSLVQTSFPISFGRTKWHGLTHMIHTQVVMTLFFTLDSLLVTRFFPTLAGDYSVALRFGQLLLFVALSLSQLLLPRLSSLNQSDTFVEWERKLYFLIVGGLACSVLFYFLAVPYLIPILFGDGYEQSGQYVKYMALVYAGITLIQYEALVQFSLHRTGYLKWYWGILVVLVLSLLLFRQTIEIWLTAQVIVFLASAVFLRLILQKHRVPTTTLKEEDE